VIDPGDGSYQIVRFRGPFQGRTIRWLARIQAQGRDQRAYISIGNIDADDAEIEIGLPVASIDTPTIKKTLVMIRQYKGLRPGRREFGIR
jgi:hypothetical protein